MSYVTSTTEHTNTAWARGSLGRRTRVAMTLSGYVVEHRKVLTQLGVLASSIALEDDEASSALLNQQEARVTSACSLQADTLGGVLSKLDLWFADYLTDGLDQPEIEAERLIVSVRADLRRLLEGGSQPAAY